MISASVFDLSVDLKNEILPVFLVSKFVEEGLKKWKKPKKIRTFLRGF